MESSWPFYLRAAWPCHWFNHLRFNCVELSATISVLPIFAKSSAKPQQQTRTQNVHHINIATQFLDLPSGTAEIWVAFIFRNHRARYQTTSWYLRLAQPLLKMWVKNSYKWQKCNIYEKNIDCILSSYSMSNTHVTIMSAVVSCGSAFPANPFPKSPRLLTQITTWARKPKTALDISI